MWLDLVAEVLVILDDAGDVEPPTGPLCDLDRLRRSLVGVNPSEEQEVVTGGGVEVERGRVDAVVHGCGVVQVWVPVGIADRDVGGGGVVALVHRDDPRRRESVDRGHDRGVDEAAERQRKEVESVVDDVELVGALEDRRDVETLGDLGVDRIVV